MARCDNCEVTMADTIPGGETYNSEGSGHSMHMQDTVGAMILGIVALVLLVAFLRAETRNRELQARLRMET